jgi:hypothetical protein
MAGERGGKYFREARFFLGGDRVAAALHIGEARQLLGYLRDRHAIGGPPVLVQYATLSDGTTIKAVMMNGQYQAEIVTPVKGGVCEERCRVIPRFISYRAFPIGASTPEEYYLDDTCGFDSRSLPPDVKYSGLDWHGTDGTLIQVRSQDGSRYFGIGTAPNNELYMCNTFMFSTGYAICGAALSPKGLLTCSIVPGVGEGTLTIYANQVAIASFTHASLQYAFDVDTRLGFDNDSWVKFNGDGTIGVLRLPSPVATTSMTGSYLRVDVPSDGSSITFSIVPWATTGLTSYAYDTVQVIAVTTVESPPDSGYGTNDYNYSFTVANIVGGVDFALLVACDVVASDIQLLTATHLVTGLPVTTSERVASTTCAPGSETRTASWVTQQGQASTLTLQINNTTIATRQKGESSTRTDTYASDGLNETWGSSGGGARNISDTRVLFADLRYGTVILSHYENVYTTSYSQPNTSVAQYLTTTTQTTHLRVVLYDNGTEVELHTEMLATYAPTSVLTEHGVQTSARFCPSGTGSDTTTTTLSYSYPAGPPGYSGGQGEDMHAYIDTQGAALKIDTTLHAAANFYVPVPYTLATDTYKQVVYQTGCAVHELDQIDEVFTVGLSSEKYKVCRR